MSRQSQRLSTQCNDIVGELLIHGELGNMIIVRRGRAHVRAIHISLGWVALGTPRLHIWQSVRSELLDNHTHAKWQTPHS